MTDNSDKKYIQYDHILPTASDIESLGKLFPINEFLKIINQFEIKSISFNPFNYKQMKNAEILTDFDDWLDNIRTLFFDLKFTYSYALFFFNAGIPDEPISISPGLNGQSEQFFPNFKNQHWYNQTNFRFYAEIFISKSFSILDNYGNLILLILKKDISLVDKNKKQFQDIIRNIKDENSPLIQDIYSIVETENFKKLKKIRNDIIHNRTPLKFRSRMEITETLGGGIAIGTKIDYITASKVRDLMIFLIFDILTPITKLVFNLIEEAKKGVRQ